MKFFSIQSLFILIAITILPAAFGQDNMQELVTDRPDQTESSSVVPEKTVQIETGGMVEFDETPITDIRTSVYNTTLLRYGLAERFELRLGAEFLEERNTIKSTSISSTESGLSPIYAGFKVAILNEQGWLPEVAFLGGLNLSFSAGDYFKADHTGASARFAFGHTISEVFSFGYNLGIEWDGEVSAPGYFYSGALGISVTDNIGTFVEAYGLIPEQGDAEHLLDAGLTYLVTPIFQLDISAGIGLTDAAINSFISAGLSVRLNN